MCDAAGIKILLVGDLASLGPKAGVEEEAGRFNLSCKEKIPVVQDLSNFSTYLHRKKMCSLKLKSHQLVAFSAILLLIFTTEASPIGSLDPIEMALVENCLRNCQICETNYVDFLEGDFCRDTCIKGRGLIQKVHCNANGLSATVAPFIKKSIIV